MKTSGTTRYTHRYKYTHIQTFSSSRWSFFILLLTEKAFIFMMIFTCCSVMCNESEGSLLQLGCVWLFVCVFELAIVLTMNWVSIWVDIECCNRLIACHIFFIQQWARKKNNPCFIQLQSTCVVDIILVFVVAVFSFRFVCIVVFPVQPNVENAELHLKIHTKIAHAEFNTINEIIHWFSLSLSVFLFAPTLFLLCFDIHLNCSGANVAEKISYKCRHSHIQMRSYNKYIVVYIGWKSST